MFVGFYIISLFEFGINKMVQKVGEEVVEMVIEVCNGIDECFIYEGVDLIYYMIVLFILKGYCIEDFVCELKECYSVMWKKY